MSLTPDAAEVHAVIGALAPHITSERLARMREVAARRTRWLTLVCERFYDLHNVAACMRTADAFGLQDVHVVTDPRYPEGARRPPRDLVLAQDVARTVSLASDRWVDRHDHGDTTAAFARLRAAGYRIALATPDAAVTVGEVALDRPLALVLGSEREGLSQAALAGGDVRVAIPMRGFVRSLNVSVAFAILMAALRERLERELDVAAWALPAPAQEALVARWLTVNVPHAAEILLRACR